MDELDDAPSFLLFGMTEAFFLSIWRLFVVSLQSPDIALSDRRVDQSSRRCLYSLTTLLIQPVLDRNNVRRAALVGLLVFQACSSRKRLFYE